MGIFDGCKPRKEVLEGELDDNIFAADFGGLVNGQGPKVYGDAKTFFQNTHPAKQLKKVCEVVFDRLASKTENGATIRLSTGFGGGKTHTLMALWHLAKNIEDPSMGTDLLPAAGRPGEVVVVGIDAGKGGVPEFASHGKTKVNSLAGELFYKLGGAPGLKLLDKADDHEASPSNSQIQAVFPEAPVLILLDELVVYMARLSERGQGNLLGFVNDLASVVSKRKQAVLIVTDPARQVTYAKESAKFGEAVETAATKLDDLFGRKVSDFDPIGDEASQVIIRRLFEKVSNPAAEKASATYLSLYQRVAQESPGLVPPKAASQEYAKKIKECYPFHPRLLETAQGRLGGLQDFQKSRGVLRMFARILRDVWEAEEDLELISAGEIDWASSRIQSDLIQRLNRDEFRAAITSDIEGHAKELDGNVRGVHSRVASALLLESLPMESNSGLEPAEATVAVLRPEDAGPEPSEALDRLVGVCWHTYPMGGKGYQFRYQPNVIKQVEEWKGDIPVEDAISRVEAEAQGYFRGPFFELAAWPKTPRDVKASTKLQLALCRDEKTAQQVCNYEEDSEEGQMPRGFVNAIAAVAASQAAFNEAVDKAQRLMAAEAILKEASKGSQTKLVREQLNKLMPSFQKGFRVQTCRAFDRVVLSGGTAFSLEEKYQVPEEEILKHANGQACLKRCFEDKELLYQANDAVDVDRFLKSIVPGATPSSQEPEAYTAKAVQERFLSAKGLRLIPDGSIVRQTVIKGIQAGKVVLRTAEGRAYDAQGSVEGPPGKRRRASGSLTSFGLDDTVFIARTDSEAAARWLKEDKPEEQKPGTESGEEVPPPPPPTPQKVTAQTWQKLGEYAGERPLLELHLIAATPASANALLGLAQPLGAEKLTLSVTTEGNLKDEGTMRFAATGIKPNHPAKPLVLAQTVFNSLAEGSDFEVDLKLSFGSGRTDLESQLKELAQNAPEDVSVKAIFDKPAEVAP